jgi:hypothetical protein
MGRDEVADDGIVVRLNGTRVAIFPGGGISNGDTLGRGVEILEQKVGDLQLLPARMDALESQILQLRGEIRDGFSAIREKLEQHDQRFDQTDRHMRVLHEEVLKRISLIKEG